MSTIIGGSSPSITFSDSTTQASAGLPLTGGTLSGALTVPTLNAPSGVLATQNGMTGIAKAWVNFDGSAATIRAGFNVSSVTRNATGKYTINFTTAMPNTNYVIAGSAASTINAGDNYRALATGSGTSAGNDFSMTTTSCNVQSVYTPGPQLFDCNYVLVAILSL